MGCLKKLDLDFPAQCRDLANIGLIKNIQEIVVINRSDIISYSIGKTLDALSIVTLATGSSGFAVGVVKNSVQILLNFRQLDNSPVGQEHSVIIKPIATMDYQRVALSQLPAGEFVVAAKNITGDVHIFGLLCGLVCTDFSVDSSNGGMLSITLKTPDNCAGDRELIMGEYEYEALKKPKA